MSHMLFRPLPPSPFPFQLLVLQPFPRQPMSPHQAAAGSRSTPITSWMLCTCTSSEALECSEDSYKAQCAAGKLTSLLTGTSCEVQVQAMGCASAALWQGQLHEIPLKPTGQADVQGLESVSLFSYHLFSLLKVTSAGC